MLRLIVSGVSRRTVSRTSSCSRRNYVVNLQKDRSPTGETILPHPFERLTPNRKLYPFNHQFQILSDVHLDYNKFKSYWIQPNAPYLVMAGDLTNPFTPEFRQFLIDNCPNFKRVFFVPGNHEFYTLEPKPGSDKHQPDYQMICDQFRKLESEFDQLTVLMKDRYDLKLEHDGQKVTLLGTTLWSYIPEDAWSSLGNRMADYQKILYQGRQLTPADTNQFHQEEKEWLIQELAKQQDEPDQLTMVITHHTPLIEGTCYPRYYRKNQGEIDRVKWCHYAFCTDLSQEVLNRFNPTAWISGHTHYRYRFQHPESGTVMANNPLGKVSKSYQIIRTI